MSSRYSQWQLRILPTQDITRWAYGRLLSLGICEGTLSKFHAKFHLKTHSTVVLNQGIARQTDLNKEEVIRQTISPPVTKRESLLREQLATASSKCAALHPEANKPRAEFSRFTQVPKPQIPWRGFVMHLFFSQATVMYKLGRSPYG